MSVFSELECAVGHPLSDKGDRRSEPGSGGDGSSMQDGGTRGLRKPSHRIAMYVQESNTIGQKCSKILAR